MFTTQRRTRPHTAAAAGQRAEHHQGLPLAAGARVGVVGGGPAGSFFALFLLDIAQRVGLDLQVDVFEPKDFGQPGPLGCNMCGGVVSESLVQALATEGILLPPTVVERGIDSYVLHTDVGVVRIPTPLDELRIAAVHRGAGPRGIPQRKWRSFDGYLLELAVRKGARVIRTRIEEVGPSADRLQARSRDGSEWTYDLVAITTGIKTGSVRLSPALGLRYRPPRAARTYISEFYFGEERLARRFGHAMHVFLLNLPRLEFAALIPKGDYLTFCLLGWEIDDALVESFFQAPEVRACLPPGWERPAHFCHCRPCLNVGGTVEPFADRMVFIGDCGVSRLYKDGIGAAYRAAKAAAVTAVFEGVSAEAFRRHYWPVCRALARDNRAGHLIFSLTRLLQRWRFARCGLLRLVQREQQRTAGRRRMSEALWDTFTGSSSYANVVRRAAHPGCWGALLWETLAGLRRGGGQVQSTPPLCTPET